MKMMFCLLCLVTLSSCATYTVVNEKTFDEKVGKATNCDILKYMKGHQKPRKIMLSDNKKYWYRYPGDIVFIFENDTLCGGSFKNLDYLMVKGMGDKSKSYDNLKVKGKYECSHKEWDDTLSNEWLDSRYRYLELPSNPEIDLKKVTVDEFLSKITPGMKKGELFRLVGKPTHSYDDNGEERWRYAIDKPYYSKQTEGFMGLAGTKLRYTGRTTIKDFVVVLKNNAVVDRYAAVQTPMTEEEKSCIPKQVMGVSF